MVPDLVFYVSGGVGTLSSLVSMGILLGRRLRGARGPQGSWRDGFDCGIDLALAHLQKLPEGLSSRGPTHHVHDIEVEVRKVSAEIRRRSREG